MLKFYKILNKILNFYNINVKNK